MTPEEILALYKRYGIEGSEEPQAGDDTAQAGVKPASAATQNLPRAPKAESAVVWKLHPDKTMEPVKISLGITDHAYTEIDAVLKGELKKGDDVIIRSITPKSQTPGGLRR
jgi:hypothetical protein